MQLWIWTHPVEDGLGCFLDPVILRSRARILGITAQALMSTLLTGRDHELAQFRPMIMMGYGERRSVP